MNDAVNRADPSDAADVAAMAPLDAWHVPLTGTQLVEASAGTGKTWTLSTLALRLVLEKDVPIQGLLIVTFTKATAAELRTRVRARLAQAHAALGGVALDDAPLMAYVNEQLAATHDDESADARDTAQQRRERLRQRSALALADFDSAAIHTIHAFCQRALGEAAFASQQPFEQEVQENDDDLRLQAVADEWRRRVQVGALSEGVLRVMQQKDDSPQTWSQALKLKLESVMAREEWPKVMPTSEDEVSLSRALTTAYDAARQLWQQHHAALAKDLHALVVRAQAAKPGEKIKDAASLKKDLVASALNAWQQYMGANDPSSPLKDADANRLVKLVANHGVKDHPFPPAANSLIELLAKHKSVCQRDRLLLLQSVLEASAPAVEDAKRAQRVLTYHDLQARLNERLQHDRALALTLRRRYPAALVDEFQDTDALQLALFQAMYGGSDRSVFFVGDPKQAIYGFRGADLHSYLRARHDAHARHTLNENQRSTPDMVAAMNALFTRNPQALGHVDLAYREVRAATRDRATLFDTRQAPHATRSLRLRLLPPDDAMPRGGMNAAKALAVRNCARDIAADLHAAANGQLMLDETFKGGHVRPLHGGDIAVIVERHAEGTQVKHALAALGIACVDHTHESVHHTFQAQELAVVLRAIDDPTRQGLVRAAMATTLLGLSASALDNHGDAQPSHAPDDDGVDALWMRLHTWHHTWRTRGVAPMLAHVFEHTRLAERELARADGERAMTNWLHLAELLHQASQQHASPQDLLQWFERRRDTRNRDVRSDDDLMRLATDRQLVQIVTIHHAKGLEFPIVHAPLLWASTIRLRSALGVRYHDDHGRVVLDFRRGLGNKSDDKKIKDRVKAEAQAEQLRKLYVALTRAVHRCVLTVDDQLRTTPGKPSQAEEDEDDASQSPMKGSKNRSNFSSSLNWLVAGAGMSLHAWHDPPQSSDTKGRAERESRVTGAWCELRDLAPEVIALDTIEPAKASIVNVNSEAPPPIVVHPSPGPLATAWRMGSFSGWMRGVNASTSAEVPSDDTTKSVDEPSGDDGLPDALASPADVALDDVLHFPRGTHAGDAIHTLLELADFTAPATWSAAVRRALQRHPQRMDADDAQQADLLPAMLLSMMRDLVDAPLRPGLQLNRVGRGDRSAECEFDLSLKHARLDAFVDALRGAGVAVPSLSPALLQERFHGHLRGFVDAMFVHEGRYHLLDWKSNHLGDAPADYGRDALDRDAQHHGYQLQLALYSVAFWRQLRGRYGRDGARQRWGGAFVVYVRGARPSWRDAEGRACGVVDVPLTAPVLDHLSTLLGDAT